ncbi:hypothetical protein COB21_00335 [Candidatus Aerophobetes bacterium]|uniref:Uncharacterized protein n=1 Tax=Aerophobetes bacterium TaxID=2030807 RepID=A0A2A4X7S5_UNCAE|nr:MAG: hypothetical protein COB21_00335 [Candidatus Aerophobetes bacterium]
MSVVEVNNYKLQLSWDDMDIVLATVSNDKKSYQFDERNITVDRYSARDFFKRCRPQERCRMSTLSFHEKVKIVTTLKSRAIHLLVNEQGVYGIYINAMKGNYPVTLTQLREHDCLSN